MRVLITHTAEDTAASVAALESRGHQVTAVPLVATERAPVPKINLTGAQGFLVVSTEGARALAEHIGVRTFPVFADSEVTAAALRRLGFKHIETAKDDAADLARLVERTLKPANGALIYACSTAAPVNLPTMLSNMGFAVRPLPLYTIRRVDQTPPALRTALEKQTVDTALFLTPDEARAFVTLVQRDALEPAVRTLTAVAATPVVAAPLRALKLAAVTVPDARDLEALFNALSEKLVDRVAEERAERERRAKEQADAEAERERLAVEKGAREKAEQARLAQEKAAAEKAEQDRIQQERAARDQAERELAEKTRRELERAAQEREAKAQAERERVARERAEKERLAAEKAVAEKVERERRAAEKAEQERIARARADAEKAEQNRIAAEKAAIARAEHERAQREKGAAEHAERERIAAAEAADAERNRVERERLAAEKAEQDRVAREKAAAARVVRERLAAEQAERERLERERLAAARAERERLAREEIARAKSEKERIALEKAEEARLERERLAVAHAEKERLAHEKAAAEKAERERIAAEKAEQDKRARERAVAEKAERERVAREEAAAEAAARARIAAERAEQDRIERERLAAEKAENERIARERAAADKAAREHAAAAQAEQERIEARRLAAERTERERLAQERAAAEKAARERLAAENAERERLERTRLAAEKAERDRVARESAAHAKAEKKTAQDEETARRNAEKERLAAAKAAGKDAAKAERQLRAEEKKARIAAARAQQPPRAALSTRVMGWFARPARESEAAPTSMWSMPVDAAVEIPPAKPPRSAVAEDPPSATMAPTYAAPDLSPRLIASEPLALEQRISQPTTAFKSGGPQTKETKTVSEHSPPNDKADKADATSPGPDAAGDGKAAQRGGGRAARLLAEDAADMRAKDQRFKYLGHSEPAPEQESAERQNAAYAATRKTGGGGTRVVALFVVLVLLAGAVFGTASWWVPRVTQLVQSAPGTSSGATSRPPDSAATLQADITALKARIGVLEQEAVNTVTPDALNAAKQEIEKRLAALEARAGVAAQDGGSITSLGDSLASQAQQLTAVSARLATLEAAIGNTARLEDLSKRLNMLEGRTAEAHSVLALSDRVTALETTGRRTMVEQSTNIALLMAVSQWREALLTGKPFALELQTAKALAARMDEQIIDDSGFAAAAAHGLPTLADLQRQFGPAAAAAMRASAMPDGAGAWYRRLLDRMMAIVTVRRLDGDAAGTNTAAVLARAENRLSAGDLAAAVTEMNGLSASAATAVAPWQTQAKARVAAENAAALAATKAVAAIAAAGKAPEAAAPAGRPAGIPAGATDGGQ